MVILEMYFERIFSVPFFHSSSHSIMLWSFVYLTRLWLRTWLFYFLGDSFVAFTNEKLILLKTLDRENLSNGHSIRVVLQCSLWESEHRRILKRFTQKVFVIVEDIDDHELFPSTKTLLIVNADSKAMKEVLVI